MMFTVQNQATLLRVRKRLMRRVRLTFESIRAIYPGMSLYYDEQHPICSDSRSLSPKNPQSPRPHIETYLLQPTNLNERIQLKVLLISTYLYYKNWHPNSANTNELNPNSLGMLPEEKTVGLVASYMHKLYSNTTKFDVLLER